MIPTRRRNWSVLDIASEMIAVVLRVGKMIAVEWGWAIVVEQSYVEERI